MIDQFLKHITYNKLFTKHNKLLLAISGGADSVALVYLLQAGGFNFELAHCNFNLRGKESDLDEKFCKDLAKKIGKKIYFKQFDVEAYCKKNKVSTQMAARNLRYNWFLKLVDENKIDYLITAHHANDNVETVLINMLRGTGIKGLVGISQKNNHIVRPLLPFLKSEVYAYVAQNKLKFRVDKSNLEDKYERNFLRLNIIPKLKKLNPYIETTFINNSAIFKQEAEIVKDYLSAKQNELVSNKNKLIYLDKHKFKTEKHCASILNFVLKPYQFSTSQVEDINYNILQNGLVGKNFKSKTHQLTIDRNELIIKENNNTKAKEIKIKSLIDLQKHFKIEQLKDFKMPKQNQLIIDSTHLIFPLIIRPKKLADSFKPFGMKGFKLVSDFFKDQKLNTFEKESCKLLINGNKQIIWIIAYRSDERYKVNQRSKSFLILTKLD